MSRSDPTSLLSTSHPQSLELSIRRSSSMAMAPAAPPVAKKVRHEMEMHGDLRIDNYYWLRDDSRSDPEVLSYLKAENEYTEQVMSGVKHFEDQLYAEIRGRIEEDDSSVPVRRGPFYYYNRTHKDKEYVQYCRRPISGDGPASVYDVMPTGPDAPEEHVILDVNIKAQGHDYYRIATYEVSPNHELVAYAEDIKGNEIYDVHIIDAVNQTPVGRPLLGVYPLFQWADNRTLLYITRNESHRPNKVWLHKLGSDQSCDICLYHEEDDTFYLRLDSCESKQYLFVTSGNFNTNFLFYLNVSELERGLIPLTPRIYSVSTIPSHRGNHFFVKRRSEEFYNSELLVCPLDNVSETMALLHHRESVNIQDFKLFSDHLVVFERENGLPKVTIFGLPPIGQEIRCLQGCRTIDFIDPVYSVDSLESEFTSSILRFSYSSMRTPHSVYDYDLNQGISVLKKITNVLGGFVASNYVTERKWATAPDGTQIPISVLYRENLVKFDGSNPLLIYGYGSYENCEDPVFNSSKLSLVDRGFVSVLAHIRGGGEMGRQWYENGKLLKKKNTFTDFIACVEYLIGNKYCSKEKLCILGGSAGGLLIGAVLNMCPDLFKAAIAVVPFVDLLTTMLDPSIPLTTHEWEEWGDPRKEEYYFYMKSYSPVDNVRPQEYPHLLVTAGLHDPRVLYSEPAKFVAKLREHKTDDNLLLFKCDLAAGHSSKSGRFEELQRVAFFYTFLLKALDMIPPSGSPL